MANPLVIVESPAKARTIAGYLGSDYTVESSVGHIRDLPRSAKDIPAAYKAEKWSRLGVDVDNDFKPLYIVSPEKKDQVRRLKKLLSEASELYLATDEDREGEAIAWHLLEVLNPKVPVKRMVFHEITPAAIQAAMDSPRDLDRRMVDAQEVRRILDRLVGYEVSPVLWKKIMPRLSAGRVQSVATRIVVQRERDRMAFIPAGYWSIDATLVGGAGDEQISFAAALSEVDGKRVATGKDFDSRGQLSKADAIILDEAEARAIATGLAGRDFAVRSVEKKPYRRRPAAPFITSTFQQEAGRKLRMSSAQAMRAAQSLYESGFITYMRTDSTTLSGTALDASRSEISKRFGADFLPDEPRTYKKKSKNAQEAHEAIRPAGDSFRSPDEVAAEVSKIDAQVYELIWQRTIASQMTDAVGETVSVRIGAETPDGRATLFSASGTVITHPGYQRVYVEGDDAEAADAAKAKDAERRLPPMSEGDELSASELVPSGHETQPPARFTEASLVKRLEELGVGRPSTYAATISTIIDRGYVWKKGTALVPLLTAFAVVRLLEEHFGDLIDYEFTARMEDDLDLIANGDTEAVPWLTKFYFGEHGKNGSENGAGSVSGEGTAALGLKDLVSVNLGDIDAREISTVIIGADEDGVPIVARVGRYGPYLQHGEDTTSIAEDIPPDELTIERALELLNAPKGDKVLGVDPETKLEVFAKNGRFGPYVQLGEMPEDDGEKPRTSSLFSTMDIDTLSLEEALKLLQLPRTVGLDPADGVVIEALNGRYGPYIKKGTDSRSLDSEEQLFTTTLEQALALLAQPKRRGRGTPKPPLRELGDDLGGEGKPMVIKDGRFGPYVTDGEVNASLRKGDTVEDITIERASELLQIRRDNPTVKKKAKKKAPAKKKKAAKRKAAKKKAPAKKAAPKKKAD